jgi:DNA-directed RNA polymerase beta' subunit
MPPKARQPPRNLVEQEGRIRLAISTLKKQEISSVRRAATVFNVPLLTLHDRLSGKQCRIKQRANGHRLTANQEASLIE